ncbi:MAG: hypothetical protein JNM98_12480 [Rhodocyclaceae bacterium]|nr:hypothetical protein [Rhodocyclaceae bacterium]
MGYSLSLLAVPAANAAEAIQQLGFLRTGQSCEYAREPLSSYVLPTNWFLVVARGCDSCFLHPKILVLLSKHFPVVACSIEEHVMFSSAEYWAAGIQVWRAEHVGENGPIHLKTSGALPGGFDAMAAGHKAAQEADGGEKAGVDHYFDIPLNAAKGVIGFKHDEDIPGVDYEGFEILRKASSSADSKPWWRFWK